MSGGSGSGFVLTPHKLSTCILLQAYVSPASSCPPFCPLSSSSRHRLALFLLELIKSSDGYLEPALEEFGLQLKEAITDVGDVLAEQLASRLLAFTSPEDLFSFVLGLRDLLATVPYTTPDGSGEEDPLLLEPNSLLGQFLRRCVLSFNTLSFEGTCRLLTELDCYRRPALTIRHGTIIDKDSLRSTFEDDEDDLEEDLTDRVDQDDYANEEKEEEEQEEDEEEEEEDMEDEEVKGVDDENLDGRGTTLDRGSNGRSNMHRAFGVPLMTSEGREPLGLQQYTELQELNGFGATHTGSGVRDGGFAFAFGDVGSRGEFATEGNFLRSYGQVEAYMKDQAGLIEKDLGSIPKAELDSKLSQIGRLAPDLHRVHYLKYLNCLHHEDYPAAMSSLHRYFDYSAGRGSMVSSTGHVSDASIGRFQAGLLSLGSMHAHFGHVSQALQALNETVRIAQQNNDDVCLAHALAALCYLLSDVGVTADTSVVGVGDSSLGLGLGPPLVVQQQLLLLLKRCHKRALELKLPHLVAFSRLALAKFDLKHVRQIPHLGGPRNCEHLGTSPLDVCKSLRLSTYLLSDAVMNTTAVLSTGVSSNIPRASGSSSGPFTGLSLGVSGNVHMVGSGWSAMPGRLGLVPESVLKLSGASHLLRSTSWELYGSAPMSRTSTLIHAYCYSHVASADDLALTYVNLAQQLAVTKGYTVALSALNMAAKKFPLHAKSRMQVMQLQLIHDQALNRGNIKLAQRACAELSAMVSPVLGVDMDLKVESSYCHIRTLLASGQITEAAGEAHALFALCYKHDMQIESIRTLLLIADIHKKAGSSVTGLPYVLASLTLCQSLNLDLLHATSMVTLAELWLSLGVDHAERALGLIHQCLPLILGHGGLQLCSRANLAIVRCHLSNPNFTIMSDPDAVLDPLAHASEGFMALEDWALASEAFYLLALVWDILGQTCKRDQAAESFQQCVLDLNAAQNSQSAVLPVD